MFKKNDLVVWRDYPDAVGIIDDVGEGNLVVYWLDMKSDSVTSHVVNDFINHAIMTFGGAVAHNRSQGR